MAKSLIGTVTSDSADKTVVITVVSRQTHPVYGKQYSVSRKYMAHDEENSAKVGDKVLISETRPYSKRKTYRVTEIIERSRGSVKLKEEVIEVKE